MVYDAFEKCYFQFAWLLALGFLDYRSGWGEGGVYEQFIQFRTRAGSAPPCSNTGRDSRTHTDLVLLRPLILLHS